MKTKKCCHCNEIKSIDNFAKDNRISHGYQSRCKACYKLYWIAKKQKLNCIKENKPISKGLTWAEGLKILQKASFTMRDT